MLCPTDYCEGWNEDHEVDRATGKVLKGTKSLKQLIKENFEIEREFKDKDDNDLDDVKLKDLEDIYKAKYNDNTIKLKQKKNQL